MLNQVFILNVLDDRATGGAKAHIDLPAALVGQPSDLFDKVFAFTFDVLGIQSSELRVREHGTPRCFDGTTRTYRERRA